MRDVFVLFVMLLDTCNFATNLYQSMGFFNFWKSTADNSVAVNGAGDNPSVPERRYSLEAVDFSYLFRDKLADANFMALFASVPEVFWPIDFVASRVAGATFVLKNANTDAITYRNKQFNKMTSHPNCLQCWSELVYQFFVQKLATGNAFLRAAMSDAFAESEKARYCDNFWVLPSDDVSIMPNLGNMPMYGVAEISDFVKFYRVSGFHRGTLDIPVWQVWHDRDGGISYRGTTVEMFKGMSRLQAQMKPISNLIRVYSARNVIYDKRGAIGFLVNQRKDESGDIAMKPDEVKEILDQTSERYGLTPDKYPYGFSNSPISFIRTNLSISELEPFEETLNDAIAIAGAFRIPSVLVPRKDQATFSNQAAAEKSVYTGSIIPMAKAFCNDLTHFLGYDKMGYYIDVDFSHVDCLQEGLLDAENVKEKVNSRCKTQFADGLITLNAWLAQIGEEQRDETQYPMYGKTKFDMDPEELAAVDSIISASTITGLTNNNPNQNQENGNYPQVGQE